MWAPGSREPEMGRGSAARLRVPSTLEKASEEVRHCKFPLGQRQRHVGGRG